MKRIAIFLITILFSTKVFAQPSNNECATATNMGTLPTPAACVAGIQDGAVVSFTGTNVGATPSLQGNGNTYQSILDCEGVLLNDQAGPALDVWYSFVASGNIVNINITGYANVNFGVWTGACNNLQAVGCSTDGSAVLEQMNAGQTYYIQVSGNNATSTDANFTVNVDNDIDCNDCFRNGTLVVNPLPVNGTYAPGTVVNFCFHIDQWQQSNTNWLHGVQFTFGAGWNAASLTTAPPPSYSGNGGTWAYYPAGTTATYGTATTADDVLQPPGFYYNTGTGGPGNNFGDPLGASITSVYTVPSTAWNFCWSLTASAVCNPGASLGVVINTSGDGESGGWGDLGCLGDPPTTFIAAAACCPPTMVTTSVICNGGATGSATATPVGTNGPYTYNWSGPASYANTQTVVAGVGVITGLTAGIYTLVTVDASSCAQTTTVNIVEAPALAATLTPVNATCAGAGSVTTVPSGGTPAYTYTWSGPGAYSSNSQNPTGITTAGVYTLTLKDSKGCILTKTTTIAFTGTVTSTFTGATTQCLVGNSFSFNNTGTAIAAHSYSFNPTIGSPATSTQTNYVGASFTAPGTYTVSHTVTSGVCVNTTTDVVIVNPNPLATLTATNPTCGNANGQVFINNTSCCAQTISSFASSLGSVSGQTVTGLAAGTPVITLTNSSGCTFTVSTTLTMTPIPTSITLVPTNATCGNNNGSFTFGSPVGGTPTYSYSINGGAFSATSPTTGLAPGTYSVTIKDANGCILTKTTSIVNVTGPTAIAGTASPASCAGATGSYTVTGVTGGTPTYSYSLNGGALTTSSTFGSLATGTHSISVTDANGCSFSSTFSVGLTAGITSATVNASTASCGTSNATATVSIVTGGVPTYSYSYDGGTYTTSANTSSLAAGSHTVIIKDVNTCTLSVTYNVISLGSPTTSITSFSNVTCFGLANGSFTVAIPTGGAGAPYTYSIVSSIQTNTIGVFSGLSSGIYNISVADAAGCIASASVNIVQPPQLVIASSSFTDVSCFGGINGQISTTVQGGSPLYTYVWSPAQATNSGILNNLAAGLYSLTVTDVNNCSVTSSFTIHQPSVLTTTYTSTPASCGSANGSATINITGGTPSYSVTWNNLPGSPTGTTAVNMPSGNNWIATITDGQGCVAIQTVVVNVSASQYTVNGFSLTKCEGETVVLTPNIVSQSSGVLYDFIWSNGITTTSATTSSISVIATITGPNQYSVTIDDHCSILLGQAVFTINVNPNPVIDFTAIPRAGCAPLTVTLTATSDGINDTFSWIEFGLTGNPQIVTLTDTGYYQVSLNVTNPSTGCSSNIIKPNYIQVYPLPIASFYANPSKTTIYESNISFINTSQGANSYNWDFGDPNAQNGLNNSVAVNPSYLYSNAGTYTVHLIATSDRGCKDTADIVIEVIPDFALYIPNTFTPDGNGLNDIFQPLGVGIDEDSFRMDIFDRWGENIFSSSNFRKGWDGTVKGNSKLAPQGVYTYKIFVRDLLGGKHPFVGHLTVIRDND